MIASEGFAMRVLAAVCFLFVALVGIGLLDGCPAQPVDETSGSEPPLSGLPDTTPTDTKVTMPYDYCEANTSPDANCYTSKRKADTPLIKLATEIAYKQIDKHPATGVKWDWGESVMMHGIYELYRVTKDQKLLDYVKAWMDSHIKAGFSISTSDTCAPANSAMALWATTGDAAYKGVVDTALNYLYNEALRTEEGGINHLGKVKGLVGVSLWLDSLFMFGNLLVRYGEKESDEKALSEYSTQFLLFSKLLQQEDGLYLHAHGWPGDMDKDIYWARGNAWVTAATFEYLRVRLAQGKPADEVKATILKQVQGAIKLQDKDSGLWWTIMNRPGQIYLETSASALFAYAFARGYRYGFLDKSVLPVIQKAIAGVQSKIEKDQEGKPVIKNISGPTNVGTFDMYANVKLEDDISYGIGAVLLALSEASGLPTE